MVPGGIINICNSTGKIRLLINSTTLYNLMFLFDYTLRFKGCTLPNGTGGHKSESLRTTALVDIRSSSVQS